MRTFKFHVDPLDKVISWINWWGQAIWVCSALKSITALQSIHCMLLRWRIKTALYWVGPTSNGLGRQPMTLCTQSKVTDLQWGRSVQYGHSGLSVPLRRGPSKAVASLCHNQRMPLNTNVQNRALVHLIRQKITYKTFVGTHCLGFSVICFSTWQ